MHRARPGGLRPPRLHRRAPGAPLGAGVSLPISVIGTGYLGAVHAACMAELGHDVVGDRRRPGQGRRAHAGQAPFFEPGLPELLGGRWPPAGCGSPPTTPSVAGARRAEVHFICVGTPQRARRVRRRHLLRRRRRRASLAPHLTPATLVVGKSTVPVGTAARLRRAAAVRARRRRRAAGLEPRVPARGLRRRGHPAPRPAGLRRRRDRPRRRPTRALLDEVYAAPLAAGTPRAGHRLRHRRAGQGLRQRVPGHQDLLHQRHGRGLRGRRRRRRPSWPTRSATTTGSGASSSTPASASAAAACPRTSARSWPAPASSAPTRP